MNDLIQFLKSQNKCLERFLSISEEYLRQLRSGDLGGLDQLELKRESILKAFALFEDKAQREAESYLGRTRDSDLINEIWRVQFSRLKFLEEIKKADSEIFEELSKTAQNVQKDIRDLGRQRETVSKFKSGWIPEAGKEIDKSL